MLNNEIERIETSGYENDIENDVHDIIESDNNTKPWSVTPVWESTGEGQLGVEW